MNPTERCYWGRVLLIVSCLATASHAGEFNPVLSIGDPAPAWQNLPGTDGKRHSLADLADRDLVVVVFTCNSCPYAVDYEDRLIEFARQHADQGVALVAINVNKVDADLMPAMQERARTKGFPFQYLFDESQAIAKQFGAIYTPECFVLDKQRHVVYMGAIDDSPDGSKITQRYVELAVAATLKGTLPQVRETVAVGCRVRFERERRARATKK